MTIGADILSAWYGAQVARTTAYASPSQAQTQTANASKSDQPKEAAPWQAESKQKTNEALLRSVLSKGKFFDAKFGQFADLDVSKDEKQLFTMYEGLRAMSAIAQSIADEDVGKHNLAFYQKRFGQGMDQLDKFFEKLDLEDVKVFKGEDISKTKGKLQIAREPSEYLTGIIYSGDYDKAVSAFEGDISFDISVRKNGVDKNIRIKLKNMDNDTPRTMENVQDFINSKLEAAGVVTRFDATKIGEKDKNGIIKGNNYGFKIKGTITEELTFSATKKRPVIFVAGVSGSKDKAAGQLTKLTSLAAGGEVTFSRRIEGDPTITKETNALGKEVEKEKINALTISDVAQGADGSIYVVGKATESVDGQKLKGDNDLVVLKYDSTGQQVWARTLGASDEAQGSSIAVDANGDIVVTGSVKGGLGTTTDIGGKDSLVVKFSEDGKEKWLQRFGGRGDDQINDVSIGSDGTIFVAGQTKSGFGGMSSSGGQDAYVRAIDENGKTLYTRAVEASSGSEKAMATAIAKDGSLLVATQKDGRAILTKYAPGDDGTGPSEWEMDLGDLGSGWIGAMEVDGAGHVYIAGAAEASYSPSNSSRLLNANSGGRDAMLTRVKINYDRGTSKLDYVTFLGKGGDNSANALSVTGGKVYLAGKTSESLTGSSDKSSRMSFVAEFNAETGAKGNVVEYTGRGGLSQATGIVVSKRADKVLDKFGLPAGKLDYADSRLITEQSSVRAGDHFYVQIDGKSKKKITIDADDTMRSLSFKVERLLLLKGQAGVTRGSKGDALKISAAEGATISLIAGADGRDALSGLGLTEGSIRGERPEGAEKISSFELELNKPLDISNDDAAGKTVEILNKAMERIQAAYQSLFNTETDDGPKHGYHGEVPAYYNQKLANYEAGLKRLFQGGGGNNLGQF